MHGPFSVLALIATLIALLVSAGIEDVRHREIADRKTGAIALLAPLWWWANGMAWWPDAALQLGWAIGVFAVFAAVFHAGWMGGGDVKLIAALALWLPVAGFTAMLVAMSIAGGAITLAMLIDHRLRRRGGDPEIPYGVAIALAAIVTIHEPILNQLP